MSEGSRLFYCQPHQAFFHEKSKTTLEPVPTAEETVASCEQRVCEVKSKDFRRNITPSPAIQAKLPKEIQQERPQPQMQMTCTPILQRSKTSFICRPADDVADDTSLISSVNRMGQMQEPNFQMPSAFIQEKPQPEQWFFSFVSFFKCFFYVLMTIFQGSSDSANQSYTSYTIAVLWPSQLCTTKRIEQSSKNR